MKVTTVYPAHPIRGDVEGNIKKIREIVRSLHFTKGVIPVAPYLVDIAGVLDDSDPVERGMGINADHEYFRRGMIDEVWLYGDRISTGMRAEVILAWSLNIPVVAKTLETAAELKKMQARRGRLIC